eukprot:CAMPEP_0185840082 /NCGR_PEP_ID=MMETSP1353-20130828/15650_1 /TAXON_ID=1077150 /ORGANISM="Erythrolobus australicus, Strain CCMP3124" /LENGTH=95 /DNA_ID=CAMNT_0028539361 /DNA_START=202 /DNA_END=485 /DNA_ORIENTATION=+
MSVAKRGEHISNGEARAQVDVREHIFEQVVRSDASNADRIKISNLVHPTSARSLRSATSYEAKKNKDFSETRRTPSMCAVPQAPGSHMERLDRRG